MSSTWACILCGFTGTDDNQLVEHLKRSHKIEGIEGNSGTIHFNISKSSIDPIASWIMGPKTETEEGVKLLHNEAQGILFKSHGNIYLGTTSTMALSNQIVYPHVPIGFALIRVGNNNTNRHGSIEIYNRDSKCTALFRKPLNLVPCPQSMLLNAFEGVVENPLCVILFGRPSFDNLLIWDPDPEHPDDEFNGAPACVPEVQCVRPNKILPTDVRDFGVVRCLCLGVDQLEFKAALVSIAASQAQSQVSVDSSQLAPTHIDVPIVQSIQPVPTIGTQSAVSTYTSTSVGQGQTLAGTAATALTTSPAVPVQFPRPGGLFRSSSLAKSQVQLDSAQLAPPSAAHPIVQSIQPLNPTGPAHFTQINTQSPSGSTFTSVSTQSGVSTAPVVVTPLEPVADAPAPDPATIPAPAPVPALLPRPAGLYGGPGLLGSPLFGGLGLGYGGGIGFRKHFSFTKGFGFGLGK